MSDEATLFFMCHGDSKNGVCLKCGLPVSGVSDGKCRARIEYAMADVDVDLTAPPFPATIRSDQLGRAGAAFEAMHAKLEAGRVKLRVDTERAAREGLTTLLIEAIEVTLGDRFDFDLEVAGEIPLQVQQAWRAARAHAEKDHQTLKAVLAVVQQGLQAIDEQCEQDEEKDHV